MPNWDADPQPPKPERVEIRTLQQAMDWGDEWMRAYARLQLAYDDALWQRDYYCSLLRHLDPFLPRWLQDEEQRASNEEIYEVLADCRGDAIE